MSTDRLTQLQDLVIVIAEQICNGTGILQRYAQSLPFDNTKPPPMKDSKNPNANYEDLPKLYAQMISQTAKDIDYLIQSLPIEENTSEYQQSQQSRMLQQLEREALDAVRLLEFTVSHCESALNTVRSALHEISTVQLQSQYIDSTLD